jgi:hypothetical protein
MEVSELLKKAWSAVEDAQLPDEIRPVAFQEAVRLLSPPPFADTASGSSKPHGESDDKQRASKPSAGHSASDEIRVSEQEIYDRVTEHTGVDRNALEHVIHLDDDVLRLSIPGMKLGKNSADKTRTVAQILTVTRGFGFNEKETDVELIRSEVIRLKCYDPKNFFAQLSKLNGFIVTGTGANRRIRAKASGISAFATLVENLAGVQ